MTYEFFRKRNLIWENLYQLDEAEMILVGVPLDSSVTGIPGTRLAPDRIREEFNLLSSGYEPGFAGSEARSLDDVKLYDAGNIEVIPGDMRASLERVQRGISYLAEENPDAKFVILGGEHSITPAVVNGLLEAGREFDYLCYDAHLDLMGDWFGLRESHTCANRRVCELLSPDRVEVRYAREGEASEWAFSKRLGEARDPIYLSVDLDVFEGVPTGTPVPGGISFQQFWDEVGGRKWIAADIVEYNPLLGFSGLPAKLLKMLLLSSKG